MKVILTEKQLYDILDEYLGGDINDFIKANPSIREIEIHPSQIESEKLKELDWTFLFDL